MKYVPAGGSLKWVWRFIVRLLGAIVMAAVFSMIHPAVGAIVLFFALFWALGFEDRTSWNSLNDIVGK